MDKQIVQVKLPEDLISFRMGQPSFSLLPIGLLNKASKGFYTKDYAVEYLQYGNKQGSLPFRTNLADFITKTTNAKINPDELFITNGASSAIALICSLFTSPGDTVFVEEPTYFIISKIFKDYKLNIESIPIDNNGIQLDKLEEKLIKFKPKILYTIPIFQNPSTITLSEEKREKLCCLCNKHNTLILADEVYQQLNYSENHPKPLFCYDKYDNVLSLGSFSKILSPGLRLGWVHTKSKSVLEELINCGLMFSGGGMNPFLSGHISAAMENGSLIEHLQYVKKTLSNRLKLLESELRKELNSYLEFNKPEGGFYIWAKLKNNLSSTMLEKAAEKQKVAILPGPMCSIDNNLDNYMRLSVSYLSKEEIIEGVERLKQAFIEYCK